MKKRRVLTILLILVLLFIWGNSVLSRPASAALSDKVLEWINKAGAWIGLGENFFVTEELEGSALADRASYIIRKAAHVTEYAVFASLLWLRLSGEEKRRARLALIAAAAVAGIDETIQIFSHRGSQFTDVCLDTIGALVGIVLMVFIAQVRRKKGKTP